MASILWSKSEKRRTIVYSDLFSDVSTKLQMEFVRWDQQLHLYEWKHRFLQYRHEAIKCETTAKHFGEMGDAYFEQLEWRKAMEMYNQAMCFAENNSNYLGILMAKRGFCFSNMNMFDAAIVDIDMALTKKLSFATVAEARANIETLKGNSKQHVTQLPKLCFECDDEYLSMANVLELKTDANNRSSIVAKADIDVGKTVLFDESFASVCNNYDKTCCTTCLNEIRNFIPCPACTDAVFCSVNCFQRNQIHRVSCGEKFHRMPTPVKFVINSILKAISMFPSIDFLIQFVEMYISSPSAAAAAAKFTVPLDARMRSYGLFLKQQTQNALPMVTVYQVYTTLLSMKSIAARFSTCTKQKFLMHLVGHHAMVLNCNSFGGFESNQNRFISGTMANLVALIEHSCTPNIVHFAYGDHEVCITIRPIRAGEHLCYDYWPDNSIDDAQNVTCRKQLLWTNWRIDCKCDKCAKGITSNLQMATDEAFIFVSKYASSVNDDQATTAQVKAECIRFLEKFKDEAWTKETEIITKAYSQCILSEYNHSYGPVTVQNTL